MDQETSTDSHWREQENRNEVNDIPILSKSFWSKSAPKRRGDFEKKKNGLSLQKYFKMKKKYKTKQTQQNAA